jgi:hypothetical protein
MKFYFDTSFSNSGLTFLQIRFCYFFLFLVKRKKITNPFIGCATIELSFPTCYSLLTTNCSLLTKN